LRLIQYIEDRLKTIDEYFALLNTMPYNWGFDWLPHDGYVKTAASTSGSCYDIGRKMGRRVAPLENGKPPIPATNVEVRIKAVKVMAKRLVINNLDKGTERFMECMKRYKRSIPKHGEPANPIHDEYSHGMDMLGHAALIEERMTNDSPTPELPKISGYRPADSGMGSLG
jgi:phage terminase large subunit